MTKVLFYVRVFNINHLHINGLRNASSVLPRPHRSNTAAGAPPAAARSASAVPPDRTSAGCASAATRRWPSARNPPTRCGQHANPACTRRTPRTRPPRRPLNDGIALAPVVLDVYKLRMAHTATSYPAKKSGWAAFVKLPEYRESQRATRRAYLRRQIRRQLPIPLLGVLQCPQRQLARSQPGARLIAHQ